jgi:glycosyltransferase involved in cell wall biosynthesis
LAGVKKWQKSRISKKIFNFERILLKQVMRILMVLDHEFPPDIRVENEIGSLRTAGHEIHLACFTRIGRPLIEETQNLTIHRKKISTITYKSSVACLRFPRYFRFWTNFLNSVLRKESFDAIHIHDLPLASVGVKLKKYYKISLIIDLHENWPAALETATHTNTLAGRLLSGIRQWRNYEKNILAGADHIITVVEEMKERIVRLGIDKTKVIVLPNTILPEQFPKASSAPNPEFITLFYAGGINIHRGLQIVIDGLAIVKAKYPNIRLWIIGTGSYAKQLLDKVKQLDMEKEVTFFGWKNHGEISALLGQSDIALIPHLKSEQTDNSSPNKLFQYMYFSKPILSSNCSSIERILNETGTGIVYTHDSPSDFAKKLGYMISRHDFTEFGKKGQAAVHNKYNWKVTSESLVNLYSQL